MPIVGITVSPAQTRRVSIVSESPRSARFSFPRSLDTEAGDYSGGPSSRPAAPAWVVRYCCFELRGFSGTVIARRPASRRGRKTLSRNLVRLALPQCVISE